MILRVTPNSAYLNQEGACNLGVVCQMIPSMHCHGRAFLQTKEVQVHL